MSSIARRFSRAARTYDRGAGLHRHVAARLIGIMPEPGPLASGRILEVGCGTGVLTGLVRQRYPSATLCVTDVAEGMVGCVRGKWGNDPAMEFVVSDVRDLKPHAPFDLIVSSSALHWATPLEQTMMTLRKALASGGSLCVALMTEGTLGELHRLRRLVAPAKAPAARLPSGEDVIAAVEAAGLVLEGREDEVIQAHYRSADDFLRTIHAQGLTSGAVSRGAVPLSRSEIGRLRTAYDETCRDEGGGVRATFEVLYLSASVRS